MEPTKPLVEIKRLKPNTSVTIEIPSEWHARIQSLLLVGIPFKDIESASKVLNTIRTSQNDPDMVTFHTRTLIWLIAQIEDAAEKQDKIETKKVDTATGKLV